MTATQRAVLAKLAEGAAIYRGPNPRAPWLWGPLIPAETVSTATLAALLKAGAVRIEAGLCPIATYSLAQGG